MYRSILRLPALSSLKQIIQTRPIMQSSSLFAIEDDFQKAKSTLNSLSSDPGNEAKLKIYGLFKQASEGPCNKPKPGLMDFVGKAKWEAWNSLGSLSKEGAMKEYVDFVNSLAAKDPKQPAASTKSDASPESTGNQDLKVTRDYGGGVLSITLNRPDKKNALTWNMYQTWAKLLNDAAKDDSVNMIVVTGAGDYFCSGNDLSNFTNPEAMSNPKKMALAGKEVLKAFVGAFIDFPKPLIGLVNGPAVGISVTTLALYDAVLASDHSTFHTPFTNLGQTPEGCSSYLFTKMMGFNRANSLLMFNQKISAQEARELGLVTSIIPRDEFRKETGRILQEWATIPPKSLFYGKELIRAKERALLHEVNEMECNRLVERWTSDDCMNAIMAFFQKRKPKL